MRQKRYRVKFAGCVKTTATIRNYFSFSTFEEKKQLRSENRICFKKPEYGIVRQYCLQTYGVRLSVVARCFWCGDQ